jgi:amidase
MALDRARRYKAGVDTEFSMQDLWRLPAAELATLIRSKQVSA